MTETVGVRELRQQASELIRRAEAGEEIIVAVSGRPAAKLVPLGRPDRTWRRVDEVTQLWGAPFDPTWAAELAADRAEEMDAPEDPWAEAGL